MTNIGWRPERPIRD